MTDYKQYCGKTVHVIYENNEVYGKIMGVNCDSLYLRLFDAYHRIKIRFDKIKTIEVINVKEE